MAATTGLAGKRFGVASIIQETNTFSPHHTTMADFKAQGLWIGENAAAQAQRTNTEFAGALERVESSGAVGVPIVRAWAMSGGILTDESLIALRQLLLDGIAAAGPLDGLVLCLHGALVAESEPAADAHLAAAARKALGDAPLVVTHDLHANVTGAITRTVDALVGFRTYPHIDQADTGRRAAKILLDVVRSGRRPATVLAKRSMLVPAESQAIGDEPMHGLRAVADEATTLPILDVSLFPVQPWLDVPELGFAVSVTHIDVPELAQHVADTIADLAWDRRHAFAPDLVGVVEAIRMAAESRGPKPALLVQSADSPTAGCTADSAAVIAALLKHGRGLRAIATVVDGPAVACCARAGVGNTVHTTLGATQDSRWSHPVGVTGVVRRLGNSPVVLTGDSMTGQEISMGRWATLDLGTDLTVLVTERPAPTFDPAAYRSVGLEPASARVVVVRSANMFRAGFRDLFDEAYLLDLPGASTPNLRQLVFSRVPRPMFPLDEWSRA